MNRSLLLSLLGLSLAANAGLALHSVRRATPSAGAAPSAASSPSTASRPTATPATAPSAARALSTETPGNASDLRGVAAELRAAGLSEAMVHRVMQSLVAEEFSRRRRAIFDPLAVPYWKSPMPTAEQTKAMRAIDRERREMMDELGLGRSPDELLARRRQFGDLPETKISAIEKIQQDYNELRRDIFEQQRSGGSRGQNLSAQIKLIDDEQRRDIEALLSPAERLDYDLRSSETANRLRGQLRALDLTEQEYRALFAAQKSYDDGRGNVEGPRSAEQVQGDVDRWDELQAAARGTLGDERYKQYLIGSQLAGRNAEQFFAERPAITLAQIHAIARMNASLPAEMMREVNAPGLSPEERRARAGAIAQKYQDALTQLVGAEAAKEIQARNLVSLPRNIGGGNAIGLPAVRLPGGN